ncbi:MAG: hypothetical protein ACP5P4_08535 [Steroidobacteraceae bacterium]
MLAIILTLGIAISVTLILMLVMVTAAVLFVRAAAAIAIHRPNAAGETEEASDQQEYGEPIGEFHERPRSVRVTVRPRH